MTVHIPTRRLGHANIFVHQDGLAKTVEFYRTVGGLSEVRREPDIAASLMSSGRTHHDIGLIEGNGQARIGLDGYTQIPKGRGKTPGLNHLGWETQTEASLIAAYHRAKAAGVRIHRTTDHQVAHSVYIFDPDGNLNEWYADVTPDWRRILNPELEDLITRAWDIENSAGLDRPCFHADPDITREDGSIFHTTGIDRVTMVARNPERMGEHYTDIGGLVDRGSAGEGFVRYLGGAAGSIDLVLAARGDGLDAGLHHITFLVDEDDDGFDEAERRLRQSGISVFASIDTAAKRSVFLEDPDGLLVEFCRRRDGRPPDVAAMASADALLHLS